MTKFKPGDRVAVYSSTGRDIGTVCGPDAFGYNVRIRGTLYFFHHKQLRRLKPKPKQEARVGEIWVDSRDLKEIDDCCCIDVSLTKTDQCEVQFKEVLPGEVVVTRESLAKIWPDELEHWFENICEKLSVPEVTA